MKSFRLFREATHFWSLEDYSVVVDVMTRLRPRRVLEFGPGASTLALIEGGASEIDSCEDDPEWAAVYTGRLVERYPGLVRIHGYTWSEPLEISALEASRYDLALVDGPHAVARRPAVIDWCLSRAAAVLVAGESFESFDLRAEIVRLADERACSLTWLETGPPAGSFGLLRSLLC